MKTTKKALALSVLSLILCVTMLLGTTYAWFTDSVKSGNNIIKAGNLDIELEYSKTGADGTWKTVESATELFADVALWEPGATSVVYLKLTNKGTLALKYNLSVNSTGGDFTNVAGEAKNLKDALKFAQVAGPNLVTYATREAAVAATSSAALGLNDYAQSNHMAANEVSYITLVVTMPTTIDNEFNYKPGTTAPEIALTVDLFATQYTAESDSFDKYYDVTAEPIDVYTVEEFNEAIKQAPTGTTINIMTADLELTVAFDTEKTYTIKGEKIKKLTADIPNGTIHVYNEVGEVVGTNVDLQNSAHFYNKIAKLLATAGHFVVEVGSTVDEIKAAPTEVKDLVIEIKGAAGTVTAPEDIPEKNVDIKVAGTVDAVVVPAADTKVAVKVSETGTVDTLNITDETEAKIVLQNFGTVGNENEIKDKTQFAADIAPDEKVLTINSSDEFKAFAKDVNGGTNYKGWTIKLGKDIDLNNEEFEPIGTSAHPFSGSFDGQNYTISNLKISKGTENKAGNNYIGLFGQVTYPEGTTGYIKDIKINNAEVTGSLYVGIIAGNIFDQASSTVSGIEITGDVKVTGYWYVGSVVGGLYIGNVKNITVNANEGSYVTSIAESGNIGGVIGWTGEKNYETDFENITVNNVDVTGTYYVGGILGHLHENCVLKNSTVSNAIIKGETLVGEFAGRYGAPNFGTVDTATCTATNVVFTAYATPDTLDDIMKVIKDNTIVTLGEGSYDVLKMERTPAEANKMGGTLHNVTFVAEEGKTVIFKGVQLRNAQNCTIDGITFYADQAANSVNTFASKTYATQSDKNGTASIMNADFRDKDGSNNITIKNCVFTVSPENASYTAANYRAIDLCNSNHQGNKSLNLTVEGCTFDCHAQNYITLDYNGKSGNDLVTVKSNTFGSSASGAYSTIHSVINATGSKMSVDIEGNTFYNWGRYIIGSSMNATDVSDIYTFTVKGNTFNNEKAVGANSVEGTNAVGLINIKAKAKNNLTKDENAFAIVEGNTFLGALVATDATAVEWES